MEQETINKNNKEPYYVLVKENDGYILGDYYFKFTKEEFDIIQWFLADLGLNIEFTKIDENIFIERE